MILALATGLVLALWQAGKARDQALIARQHALRAETTKNFVVSAFNGLNPTASRDGIQISLADFVLAQVARLDTDLADAPQSRAELRGALGMALHELGRLPEANATLNQAVSEFRTQLDAPGPGLISALQGLAINAIALGDHQRAMEHALEAVNEVERVADLPEHQQIESRRRLATLTSRIGRHHEALAQWQTLYALELERTGRESPRELLNICVELVQLARYDAAEQHCARARSHLQSDPQAPPVPFALIGNVLGLTHFRQGRWTEAEVALLQAKDRVERYLGDEHPLLIPLMTNLAALYLAMAEPDRVQPLLERSTALLETTAANDYRTSNLALHGRVAAHTGAYRTAEDRFAQALDLAREQGTENSVSMLRVARELADIHLQLEQYQAAETLLEELLKRFENNGLTRHDEYGWALQSRARLLTLQGHTDQAETFRQTADRLLLEVLGETHPLLTGSVR